MRARFAQVHILDIPYSADRDYTYAVPESLGDDVSPGVFCMVPMGRGNHPQLALVTGVSDSCDLENVKVISDVCPRSLSLDESALELCAFMKRQTLCSIGDAARSMVPSASLGRVDENYELTSPPDEAATALLSKSELEACSLFENGRGIKASVARKMYGPAVLNAFKKLATAGILSVRPFLKEQNGPRFITEYTLPEDTEETRRLLRGEGPSKIRSDMHRAVLSLMLDEPDATWRMEDLSRVCGATSAQISSMVKHNWLRTHLVQVTRDPYASVPSASRPEFHLNEEQSKAFSVLSDMLDRDKPDAALLYGVTGSGKTCIIIKSVERVLAQGRSAIVLLPEIALTPQSVAVFKNCFGDLVTVLHSGLSQGERIDAYDRIKRGEVRIVIGTRSAVFAPVVRLGLIVLDEEQESTYKSDQNPKYHARDVARFRCASQHAVMLLCSATPSLESYQKAVDGTYRLLTLTRRFGTAKLPDVTITDMRRDIERGNDSPVSETLLDALIRTYQKNEQAILFLNRRGYNHYLKCESCGEVVNCPNCSVSMTYHTASRDYKTGYLCCHWCGSRMPAPVLCPSCGGKHLSRFGYGTQRVEETLPKLIPGIRVLRMDMDTTAGRFAYDDILARFRNHEADVLLGTQMVTKGHDFPQVTLVGILDADASLFLDDYRAGERTFAMLTQVVGRAGRADKPGQAVIQTSNSGNRIIQLACAQDYPAFFSSEIELRRELSFPPFCDIVLLALSGTDEAVVRTDADKLYSAFRKTMQEHPEVPMILYGPFEAPVFRVEGQYRMRILLKCRWSAQSRALIEPLFAQGPKDLKIRSGLSIDVNPSSV